LSQKHVIINLDKPKGISSQQAVTRVKKIWNVKKAGHAGTLDPLACGILLVCLSEATKITRFLSDLDKEYLAVMKLGEKTDTLDSEGEVIRTVRDFSVRSEEIEEVLSRFCGIIQQTPPMYSALKRSGMPLYKLARRKIAVVRPEREVQIHSIEMTGFNLPFVEIKVSCSKGTYVRTLCDDIGEVLGVGAHIIALRRTRVGRFLINNAISVEGLEEMSQHYLSMNTIPSVLTINDALKHLAEITLTQSDFRDARNGIPLRFYGEHHCDSESFLRLNDPIGNLFAIGRLSQGNIKIERRLHLSEES
jgi:tRNA pseudouridine55 synthase